MSEPTLEQVRQGEQDLRDGKALRLLREARSTFTQDALDGAALRLLREAAIAIGWLVIVEQDPSRRDRTRRTVPWEVTAWCYAKPEQIRRGQGATVAEACDAARLALVAK